MRNLPRPKPLSGPDQKALASMFFICWGALVLEPRHPIRAVLRDAGLIERRGRLALSRRGERALALAKAGGPKR